MSDFTYPSNELQSGEALLDAAGSFWSSMYAGRDLVQDIFFSLGQAEQQTLRDEQELIACVSRFTTPVYHTEHWYSLITNKSTLGSRVLQYGDGAVYGNDPVTGRLYHYGEALRSDYYLVKMPAGMKSCTIVQNRMTDPAVVWVLGVDFYITADGYFAFRENPFTTDLFASREIIDEDGNVTDEELKLWCYYSQWERYFLRDHWGWLLNIEWASGQPYKDLLNATLDSSVEGTADIHVEKALSAVTGIKLAETDNEVVEEITNIRDQLVIITDKNVYTYNDTASSMVDVGDTVQAGDPLVDSMIFYTFTNGVVPPELKSIAVGEGMIGEGYLSGVTFRNKTVPVAVTTQDSFTKVSFELGGFPSDVEEFWNDVHERGIALGKTLAHLLDSHGPDADTEPTADRLPSELNPLEFLIENLLRFHTYCVHIRVMDVVDTGLDAARALRKMLPPWEAAILIYELEFADDAIVMDGPGDELNTGYTEDLATLPGMTPFTDDIAVSSVTESFLLNQVTIVCR